MKQYKKPLMKIVELEKVDVLTCSVCEKDTVFVHSGFDGCKDDCSQHLEWANNQNTAS